MAARAVAVFANLLPMQAWFAPSASVFYLYIYKFTGIFEFAVYYKYAYFAKL